MEVFECAHPSRREKDEWPKVIGYGLNQVRKLGCKKMYLERELRSDLEKMGFTVSFSFPSGVTRAYVRSVINVKWTMESDGGRG